MAASSLRSSNDSLVVPRCWMRNFKLQMGKLLMRHFHDAVYLNMNFLLPVGINFILG